MANVRSGDRRVTGVILTSDGDARTVTLAVGTTGHISAISSAGRSRYAA